MQSKTIQSLTGRKLKITNPGNTYIHLDFTDNRPDRAYGNFSRAELIAALAAVGVKGEEFPKEPTPQERWQAQNAEVSRLPNGTVIEVTSPYGTKSQYHKIGGKWERDNDIVRFMPADFMSLESTYTIKYNPKED